MTSTADIARSMADNRTHSAVPLYGKRLRVHFVLQIRRERRFPGPRELADQIERDAVQASEILANSPA